MTKIEQIENAIEKALRRESKLTLDALNVPALSSLNIRHLMNNLGAISTRYLEQGVHKGGLFCSTIFGNDNLQCVTAVDSWASDKINAEKAEDEFYKNVYLTKPVNCGLHVHHKESFDITANILLCEGEIDLYLFDADHSEDSQCRALAHFIPAMANEFIFCVDDYDWADVRNGTERGINETGVEVLFSNIWEGNDHDNEGAWNGFAVFLLKKKA